MPELPEVENITQALQPLLIGKSFRDIEVRSQRSFWGDKNQVLDKTIVSVRRRAKLIMIKLEGGIFLLIHLKMTGQLIWLENPSQPRRDSKSQDKKLRDKKFQAGNFELRISGERAVVGGHPDRAYSQPLPHQYTRVIFELSDGSRLFFNDLRLFGWIKVLTGSALGKELQDLGSEPLDFKFKTFRNLIQKYPRRKIKEFLQDQKLVVGIGNIYSSEILFCAEILPDRKVGEIGGQEAKKLFNCIGRILKKAIHLGGTSMSDYRKPDGSRGGYLNQALVYQRAGEKCKKCGAQIRRQKIGQRSAFYCPNCQR